MVKPNPINDITTDKDFQRYKSWTNSLWTFPRNTDPIKNDYPGLFVYQIPERLIVLYTKTGDCVHDYFAGSGTTRRAAMNLNRDSSCFDIVTPKQTREHPGVRYPTNHFVFPLNATDWGDWENVKRHMRQRGKAPTLSILHPPYHDIINWGESHNCLARIAERGVEAYLAAMTVVVENAVSCLAKGGHLALVMGDVYKGSELKPASDVMNLVRRHPRMKLKATYIKDIQGNVNSKGQKNGLWASRAIAGGFNVMGHEYVFVFRKDRR